MDIRKSLKRKTTSSDDSVSSKSAGKISWDKDKENINVSTNWNNKGVEEDGLSNDIFYLLDKKLSDNEKFQCIRHRHRHRLWKNDSATPKNVPQNTNEHTCDYLR